jgi:hypothetical protein
MKRLNCIPILSAKSGNSILTEILHMGIDAKSGNSILTEILHMGVDAKSGNSILTEKLHARSERSDK